MLLCRQLVHPSMDQVHPVCRSTAHFRIMMLQVLYSRCLRITTNAPWYFGNRQIRDDLEVPYFESKLADVGNI
jgi:hypothetical protein